MNSVADVSFSALLVRNGVKWMEKKGWIKSGLVAVIASTLLNFVVQTILTLADEVANGTQLTAVIVKATMATVLTSLYHDFKEAAKTSLAPVEANNASQN